MTAVTAGQHTVVNAAPPVGPHAQLGLGGFQTSPWHVRTHSTTTRLVGEAVEACSAFVPKLGDTYPRVASKQGRVASKQITCHIWIFADKSLWLLGNRYHQPRHTPHGGSCICGPQIAWVGALLEGREHLAMSAFVATPGHFHAFSERGCE